MPNCKELTTPQSANDKAFSIQHIYGYVSQKYIGKNVFIMNKMNDLTHENYLLMEQKRTMEHIINNAKTIN